MAFSISWTDFPELADKEEYIEGCVLQSKDELNHAENTTSIADFSSSQYTFISGDNYPVLKILEKTHAEKINFIYIDPPYNTGKKFVYNDSFKSNISGSSSENSTVDRHSAWLSFMKRRLEIAKRLLTQDGCIFISIGNEEVYHLKILCDMIFGEDNFVNDFMWLCGKGKKNAFSRTLEQSTLCYAKNIRRLKSFSEVQETAWAKTNADGDKRGNWFSGSISFSEERSNPSHPNYFEIVSPGGVRWKRQWLVNLAQMDELLKEEKIYWGPAPSYDHVPRKKIFNGECSKIIPRNVIDGAGTEGFFGVGTTRDAQFALDKLLGAKNVFDNPKPVGLIEHLIKITDMGDDITVLDFFAGSGTTMEAVFRLNQADGGKRKCILVQKPDEIESPKNPFRTISELCLERCKCAGISNISEYELLSPR